MRRPRIGVTPYFFYDKGEEYLPEGYIRGIEHLNGEIVVIHYNTQLDTICGIVETLDGVIFAGGPDVHPKFFGQEIHPKCGRINLQRDEMELELFRCCAERKLPILAICRGIQLVNVAMGGTIYQDIPSAFPGVTHHEQAEPRLALSHDVHICADTPLSRLYDGADILRTNSFHHQALDRVADGLLVNALSQEGFAEAVTGTGEQFILGTQWHPEISYNTDENSKRIFTMFKEAVESYMA